MGGLGSTRWRSHWKKTTVEECLSLSIKELCYAANQPFSDLLGTTGSLAWNSGASVGYTLRRANNRLSLILSYTFSDGKEKCSKTAVIQVSSTYCNYGGYRYWLHCPHCQRRVAKLYLAWGKFGCRECHDLAYSSAQEAHQFDSLKRLFGAGLGILDRHYEAAALIKKWEARKRLTKGERCKIADELGIRLFMVRSRWYRRDAQKRRAHELAAKLVENILK